MALAKHYEGVLAIAVFGGFGSPVVDRVVRTTVSRRMARVHPLTP